MEFDCFILPNKSELFPISLEIIHSYLSFKSLLETYKAEFIIQGKHYNTEPIKIIYLESSVALINLNSEKYNTN